MHLQPCTPHCNVPSNTIVKIHNTTFINWLGSHLLAAYEWTNFLAPEQAMQVYSNIQRCAWDPGQTIHLPSPYACSSTWWPQHWTCSGACWSILPTYTSFSVSYITVVSCLLSWSSSPSNPLWLGWLTRASTSSKLSTTFPLDNTKLGKLYCCTSAIQPAGELSGSLWSTKKKQKLRKVSISKGNLKKSGNGNKGNAVEYRALA